MSEIELVRQRCVPCEGGVDPLNKKEADLMLTQAPDWSMNETITEIERTFIFKNYYETMAFVNALAWIAHREDHHPDIEVGYNRCYIRYSTHSIGGLSTNDFICAARIDKLLD